MPPGPAQRLNADQGTLACLKGGVGAEGLFCSNKWGRATQKVC